MIQDVIFELDLYNSTFSSPFVLQTICVTVLIAFILLRMDLHIRVIKLFNISSEKATKFSQELIFVTESVGIASFTVSGVLLTVIANLKPL